MIKIENLTKDWKEFKINQVNLQVEKNEYFVILGPSGSGKTMLLELIAGIWPPDSGKIYLENKDITYAPLEKRGVGFVYQNYMLFPHKTVFENIAFGLNLRKIPKKEIETKVTEMMGLLKISHLKDRLPRTLSGGEQQRTALARALIIHPEVLLMDEPLSALDKKTRDDLIHQLKEIHEKFDITLIHVTHNFDEALQLADRVAIMKHGTISQVGNVEEVFRHPANGFVADFVGVKNVIKGWATHQNEGLTTIKSKNISIYSSKPADGEVFISIRPEDITLSLKKVNTSALNKLEGIVQNIISKGPLIHLNIKVGQEIFIVYMTRKSFLDMNINIGKKLWLEFKASAVHIFQ